MHHLIAVLKNKVFMLTWYPAVVAYSSSEWQKPCSGERVPAVSICDMGVLGHV